MWIRTQNKEGLVDCKWFYYNKDLWSKCDVNAICGDCNSGENNGMLLGEYKNQEQAFKVLDLLEEAVERDQMVFHMPTQDMIDTIPLNADLKWNSFAEEDEEFAQFLALQKKNKSASAAIITKTSDWKFDPLKIENEEFDKLLSPQEKELIKSIKMSSTNDK